MTFEDYRRWRDNEEEPEQNQWNSQQGRRFSKRGVFETEEELDEDLTPPVRPNLASGGLFDFGAAPQTLVVSNPNESTK